MAPLWWSRPFQGENLGQIVQQILKGDDTIAAATSAHPLAPTLSRHALFHIDAAQRMTLSEFGEALDALPKE